MHHPEKQLCIPVFPGSIVTDYPQLLQNFVPGRMPFQKGFHLVLGSLEPVGVKPEHGTPYAVELPEAFFLQLIVVFLFCRPAVEKPEGRVRTEVLLQSPEHADSAVRVLFVDRLAEVLEVALGDPVFIGQAVFPEKRP